MNYKIIKVANNVSSPIYYEVEYEETFLFYWKRTKKAQHVVLFGHTDKPFMSVLSALYWIKVDISTNILSETRSTELQISSFIEVETAIKYHEDAAKLESDRINNLSDSEFYNKRNQ